MIAHYWRTIGGWFKFRSAYDLIVLKLPANRPSTVVEVGSWLGRSTAYMGVEIANSGKPATLVAIDHFKGSAEIIGAKAALVRGSEAAFRKNLAPVAAALGDRFKVVVEDSSLAAAKFEDRSIDAVWIDAAHEYPFIKADIVAWWPKVRPGGLIGGDDYVKCAGVKQAVDEHFGPTAAVAGTPYWMVTA